MDTNLKLKELRDRYDLAKGKVIRSTAAKEQLEKNLSETILELEKIGIKPENLESELERIQNEVNQLFLEIENSLNEVDSIAEGLKTEKTN